MNLPETINLFFARSAKKRAVKFTLLLMGAFFLFTALPAQESSLDPEGLLPGRWQIKHVYAVIGEEVMEDNNLLWVVDWEFLEDGTYLIYHDGRKAKTSSWSIEEGKLVTLFGEMRMIYAFESLDETTMSVFMDNSIEGLSMGSRYVLERVE